MATTLRYIPFAQPLHCCGCRLYDYKRCVGTIHPYAARDNLDIGCLSREEQYAMSSNKASSLVQVEELYNIASST